MFDFMSKIRFPVAVTSQEQSQLEQWESAHGTPQQVALRCRIVLCAINGQQNKAIADRLKVSRPTVNLWRKRVRDLGIGQVFAALNVLSGHGWLPKMTGR
jgi:FixJ family two-component response regulator